MKPSLIELLTRVHVSLADIDGREPLAEATELVSVGPDCHGRPARLTPETAVAWSALLAAARDDGVGLQLVSGYRSYEQQARIWERKLRAGQTPGEIRRVVAVPGFSQHHTGRALDIGTPGYTDLTEQFAGTRAFHWLTERAPAFGFSMPYTRDNTLGIAYEPWHWFFTE